MDVTPQPAEQSKPKTTYARPGPAKSKGWIADQRTIVRPLQSAVDEHGVMAVCRYLGLPRGTLYRVLEGEPVRIGTIELIRGRL